MPKVDTEIVAKVVRKREPIARISNEIIEDLKKVLEQEAAEKEIKPKAPKKEFVIIVSDPKGVLKTAYPDGIVGWVTQIEEGEAPQTALDKLHTCVYNFNSGRGRKLPIETVGEACETLKTKETKEHKLWIKTKEPVLVISTDNKIPSAPLTSD